MAGKAGAKSWERECSRLSSGLVVGVRAGRGELTSASTASPAVIVTSAANRAAVPTVAVSTNF